MAPAVFSTFSEASRGAEALVRSSLPRGAPVASPDALVTPADSLRIAADIDTRTVDASLSLLRRQPTIAAFFVYIGGFDTVCHAFWRYRFPAEFAEEEPDGEAVRKFGPVIDHYLEAVDEWVGQLIDAYAQPPNVIVVADHGAEALHGNRSYSGAHSPRDGIFAAAGPGIPHRTGAAHVSYYDVAPSVLELMGFAPLADMPGRSFLRDTPADETRVGNDAAARSSRDG
jgi:predicted AlkP superfamily phosphohydrolase/phosphomutase